MKDSGIAAIVLAAGLSERMGRFKPLLPLGACRIIERVVKMFQGAGVTDIIVVAGHRGGEVRQAVDPLNVRCVQNADYPQGMFSSVLAGVRSLPEQCRAFFIQPVDIPMVRSQTVRRLVDAFEGASAEVLYPTFDGRRGHPTMIGASLKSGIIHWRGTGGLRTLLQGHEAGSLELPVADEAVLLDLDTPGDYQRMQARLPLEGLPGEAECRVLMEQMQVLPPSMAAHCRAVAAVAQRLAKALTTAGVSINVERVRSAALLHDIARTSRNHAAAGARLLESHGFSLLAPIVKTHMDLEVVADQPIDEAQVVYLADKLVAGDRLVDLEQRLTRKMAKYGRDPCAVAAIARRMENARRVQFKVERITGRGIAAIAGTGEALDGSEP
jgi:molybdenum cofactor cytidylyltransferase